MIGNSRLYGPLAVVISLMLVVMPTNIGRSAAQSSLISSRVITNETSHQVSTDVSDERLEANSTSTANYRVGGPPEPEDWPIQSNTTISDSQLQMTGFNYSDFTSLAGLSLTGVAAQHNDRLRLTPSVMYETGAAWYTTKQPVQSGFETTFQFQITDIVHEGADGFAFVVQNHSGLAMGSGGGSLGYAAIPNSLAVEFDTSVNDVIGDPNDNHISVQTRGTEVNDENHDYALGTTTTIPDLSDGSVHTATVIYQSGQMQIFLDSPSPILTVAVNLSETLELDEGHAWIGFTAATGGMWENHDILSWSFVPSADGMTATNTSVAPPHILNDAPAYTGLPSESQRSAPPKIDTQRPQYGSSVGRAYGGSVPHVESFVTSSQASDLEEDSIPSVDLTAGRFWQSTSALTRIASPDVTFVVTNTADTGPGSLREAMGTASSGDIITFDAAIFSPANPTAIMLDSPLPNITQGNLTLDACDAGVVLDGRNLSQGHGLCIMSDGNVVKGLKIINFPNDGIEISSGAKYNQIGGDWTLGEGPHGEGNIITLNGNDGVDIHGAGTMSNTVSGNLIGLDIDGTRDFRVQEIAVSPVYTQDHTVFVGTRYDGVWKSTDGGETWAAVNDGLTISNVLEMEISPAYGSDQTLFVGSEQGSVFRTTDGGASWIQVDGGMVGERRVQALEISPNYANDGEVFVVDDDKGLFVSTDGGDTWENRSAGLSGYEWELRGLKLSPDYAVDQTLFAFSWGKLFKSTDQGHSWIQTTSGLTISTFALSPNYAVDQTAFLGLDHCEADTKPVFLKTTDGGAHWTPISGTVGTCGVRALQIAPNYPISPTLFTGDAWSGVYRSTDDGASWIKVKSSRFNWALAISPFYAQDQTLFVGQNTGEMFKSTDAGDTWTPLGANLTEQGNYNEGVHIWDGAQFNVIGGENIGEKNIISNNGMRGVVIDGGDTSHNKVVGNYIGSSIDGTKSLGNDAEGVILEQGTRKNLIHNNVIGGNALTGLQIRYVDTISNVVTGNYVGVDVSGERSLGNNGEGIILMEGAQGNYVGGATSSERNVIGGNAGGGVTIWHPGTERNVILGNYIGTDSTGKFPLGNYQNGIDFGSISEHAGPRENRVGGDLPGEKNVISANGGHGVGIGRSTYNTIIGNYIGVDATGTVSLGNHGSGVGIYAGSRYNRIGGETATERNIISGNYWHGIDLWNSTTMSNTISGNYIGTNVSGTVALGNHGAGVGIWGGRWNRIGGTTAGERNIISGNGSDGITLSDADTMSNTITGNYIGLDTTGTMTIGNVHSGINIGSGPQSNRIGGPTSGERNVVSGNGDHGISIWGGGTKYNSVIGNYIGTDDSGTVALGNAIDGMFLGSGTQHNEIGGEAAGEGNVISGNGADGVGLWNNDTMYNLVLGNHIGVDVSGVNSMENGNVGVAIGDGAQVNRIGGDTSTERNIISGNDGHGIGIWNSGTTSNTVVGNYIGTDASGTKTLGNRGCGIVFADGAQYNRLGGSTSSERNVISGNGEHGVGIWETDTAYNVVIGNYIGIDSNGTQPLGNNATGVGLGSRAQYNRIGGATPGERNVIGGNYWAGVGLWGIGTMSNTIIGNYIGTDASGTASLRNYGAGVGLREGAQYNQVGGTEPGEPNLISGNEDAGVWLSGSDTMSNTVINNYIGVTSGGITLLGNRHGVACLQDAQFNLIEGNVIGGSVYDGIHFDSCDRNIIIDNYIGFDAGETLDLANNSNGIRLFNDAQENVIGPGNVIAHNDKRGVSTEDPSARYNKITRNAIYDNFASGIVNGNGGNIELVPPTLTHVTTRSVSGLAPAEVITIELFSDRSGQGRIYEGYTIPDVTGAFVFTKTEPLYGPNLTAIGVDTEGNTSEFSMPAPITEPDCLPQSRYETFKTQALNQYPDDLILRIEALIESLDIEWGNSNGAAGLEWAADEANPMTKNFGYHSIVWTDTGTYTPVADPVGTWVPEPDFHHVGWGAFHATGRLRMHNSGRSIRICSDTTASPPTDVNIQGPLTGTVRTNDRFIASVLPITTTKPITYHWQATDHPPLTHIGELSDEAVFHWLTSGEKFITVTAMNAGGVVTGTTSVMIFEADPFAFTGYAVSIPVTPTRLASWESYTLTADIPSGTSMCASVLDPMRNPIPEMGCISMTDGLNVIDLDPIDPSIYPALRLRVDLTSTVTVFTLSPALIDWQLAASIRPTTPMLDEIINNDGEATYLLDWSDASDATSYVLEEDDNADFISPTILYTGSDSEYTRSDQVGGTWYYRVKAVNAGVASDWSNIQSTTVKPTSPVLNAIANADQDDTYVVQWSDVTGAITYTLQEDDNADFTTPTTCYTGGDVAYTVSDQTAGAWYYRVKASNSAGDSVWSNVESAGVLPIAPELYAIANPNGDDTYAINWSDVLGADTYTLEEDDNTAFSSPIVRYIGDGSGYTIQGQAMGIWYYRVKASNSVGGGDWSNITSVAVRPDAPVISTIDNTNADGNYIVDWSEVTDAISYTLEEDDNLDFNSPTVRYIGSNSEYAVSDQAVGTWYYRVKAVVSSDLESNWSNIASTNVVKGAVIVPSTWAVERQTLFFLAEVQAEEVSLDLYTVTLQVGAQSFPLYDNGMGDDFQADDGLYSARVKIPRTDFLTATLRLGPQILGQQDIHVIADPDLVMLTDWDAFYTEFRDTEMPIYADENNNDSHDFFDLMVRLQQYARTYRGVVVNLPDAIKEVVNYPVDYASLNYSESTDTRLQMGHLIDQLIANLNEQADDSIQDIVLLGDDQVVPFYRVYDPTDFYNDFNQNFPDEYRSREIDYPDTVGGTQENATLLDSEAAYIMSDVPYGIRTHQVITRGTWLSMHPDLPRWATYPEPEMGVGRIFAAQPHELIRAINRYDRPLHMTPETAHAALFRALDKTEGDEEAIDFSALAERSLFPNIRDWFGANLDDYDQVTQPWGAAEFTAALENYDLVSWWGHTTHQTLHTSQDSAINWRDFPRIHVTQPVAFSGLGCHLGYSVSRHPDGGGPVYPYAWGIVNALIPQGVTYFAPSSQAYTWPKAFQSSNLHELVIAQFTNRLMDYTAPTVGAVWQKGFHPYHATDPAVVENNNPATRIFHIAAAYGNVLYGLPTQPIERVQPRGIKISYRPATSQDWRSAQDTIVLPNLRISLPNIVVKTLNDGSTLFSIPNEGTHLAPTNGPALPLIIRTLTLPDNVQVEDVEPIEMQSQPYQQRVTLARPQLETSNGAIISGTYSLPGVYPENLFTYRVAQTEVGQDLILSVIPLQYDKSTHQVTLYTQMDFQVKYRVTTTLPGPKITAISVNAGEPLQINAMNQPLHVEILHNRTDNVSLMWSVQGPDGFMIASGNMPQHVINGTVMVDIPLETTGWRPGPKDLAVYLVHEGRISDSENIPLDVQGLGIDDLALRHHVYAEDDGAATWQIAVRDETGALVDDLEDTIDVEVDGELVAAEVQAEGKGEYHVQLPLDSIEEGRQLVRISATDARGITGWREWSVTKLSSESREIYLPLVLKEVSE